MWAPDAQIFGRTALHWALDPVHWPVPRSLLICLSVSMALPVCMCVLSCERVRCESAWTNRNRQGERSAAADQVPLLPFLSPALPSQRHPRPSSPPCLPRPFLWPCAKKHGVTARTQGYAADTRHPPAMQAEDEDEEEARERDRRGDDVLTPARLQVASTPTPHSLSPVQRACAAVLFYFSLNRHGHLWAAVHPSATGQHGP